MPLPPEPKPEERAKEPQRQKRVIAPHPIIKKWPESQVGNFINLTTDTYQPNESTKITTELTLMPNYTDEMTGETETKLSMDLNIESNIFQEQPREEGQRKLELYVCTEVYDTAEMITLSRKEILLLTFPKGKRQIRVVTSLAEQTKIDQCDKKNLEIRVEPRVECYMPIPILIPEGYVNVELEDANNKEN